MFKVIYKDNVCVVAATKKVLDNKISFYLYDKRIKEWLFLILTYGSQIALYSYTFAFSRYAISMFFIRYIVIGIGIGILYDIVKNRRKYDYFYKTWKNNI